MQRRKIRGMLAMTCLTLGFCAPIASINASEDTETNFFGHAASDLPKQSEEVGVEACLVTEQPQAVVESEAAINTEPLSEEALAKLFETLLNEPQASFTCPPDRSGLTAKECENLCCNQHGLGGVLSPIGSCCFCGNFPGCGP